LISAISRGSPPTISTAGDRIPLSAVWAGLRERQVSACLPLRVLAPRLKQTPHAQSIRHTHHRYRLAGHQLLANRSPYQTAIANCGRGYNSALVWQHHETSWFKVANTVLKGQALPDLHEEILDTSIAEGRISRPVTAPPQQTGSLHNVSLAARTPNGQKCSVRWRVR